MRALLLNLLVAIIPLTWCVLLGLWNEIKFTLKLNFSKRDLVILTTTSEATILYLITEGLSLFKGLSRSSLFFAWLFFFIMISIGYAVLLRRHYQNIPQLLSSTRASLSSAFNLNLRLYESVILFLIVLQIFILGIVALVYPSTTWDSMVYHMARVMHWEQEQSIGHYATGISRQIQLQPFAEYAILNLQILFGSDRFANMVQWAAMVLSALAVSNIAKKLGATRDQQLISALLVVVIPIGILEATSTQNDYVVTYWVTCLVSICLCLIKEPDSIIWRIAAGLSLGLALFTKGTAYVFAAAIMIFAFVFLFREKKFKVVPVFITIGIVAFLLNVSLYIRNYQTFSSPLGPTEGYHNKMFTPAAVASNAIRNTVSNIPTSSENPILKTIYQYSRSGLRLLHELTGLSPVDKRTTFNPEYDAFVIPPLVSEEMAPNPTQIVLILLVIITFVSIPLNKKLREFFWEDKGKRMLLAYTATLCLAFVFFCLYLMWQPWGNRLLLPLFVLWCAVIPLAILNEHRMYFAFAAIFIGIISFNTTFNNTTRPITVEAQYSVTPREKIYFVNQPDLYPIFTDVAQQLKSYSCRKVGLVFSNDLYEYPLWMVLLQENKSSVIRFVQLKNGSKQYEDKTFEPCGIISNKKLDNSGALVGKYKYTYGEVWLYKVP